MRESVRHTWRARTRSALVLLTLLSSVSRAQEPAGFRPLAVTIAAGFAAASTNRDGSAYGAGIHRVAKPWLVIGAQFLYHPLDHATAQYAGPSPCRHPGCTSERPGAGLFSLLLDVEWHLDPALVGLYGSAGTGAGCYRDPPEGGARVVPALTAAAGFDFPIRVARVRVEVRYLRLVGRGANAVDLGTATLGVVLPGCLTSACS